MPLLAALALALTVATATAQTDTAANYPNRPVRLIVGFAAGGGTDAARIVAPKLTELLGQPVVIENRAGAGGRTAIEFVQSQPPDGYTLAFGAIGQMAVTAAIYPNLPFHPTGTLTPVGMTSSYQMVIAVAAGGDIKSVQQLVAFAKAHPDKSNYPTASPTFTIASELLKLKTGMPGQLVPYRSSNEMMLSLIGGQSLFVFGDTPTIIPLAQSGRVRALAVASASRIAELPDIPTLAEAGLGDLDVKPQWNGVFAAAGTPQAIVRKLEQALRKVSEDDAVRARTRTLFYSSESAGSDTFRARIDSDIKAFADVVKAANLKFEQ
ncbi:MAG: tripartite tricarboxylate transporter substrate binding protein [Xanthobacteraceae bacterium]|nr:tripartite tricarboxylate transporter substrate binding protein [Xanthobacteraceae bacterium]